MNGARRDGHLSSRTHTLWGFIAARDVPCSLFATGTHTPADTTTDRSRDTLVANALLFTAPAVHYVFLFMPRLFSEPGKCNKLPTMPLCHAACPPACPSFRLLPFARLNATYPPVPRFAAFSINFVASESFFFFLWKIDKTHFISRSDLFLSNLSTCSFEMNENFSYRHLVGKSERKIDFSDKSRGFWLEIFRTLPPRIIQYPFADT